MVDTCHRTFIQTFRMYNAKSEASCKLRTLVDKDVSIDRKGEKKRRKGRGKGKRKEENELQLRKWKSEKRFQIPDLTGGFLGLLKKKKKEKEKEKEKKKRSVINKKKTYLGAMNTLNI
ncbi:uncharacterized protein [Gorilla gorilla gorilla]|uniref:uncharacterized protein n=1 Tax=Gorilla gorilla gorilla TaxID=9595 RepID=UPI0030083AA8